MNVNPTNIIIALMFTVTAVVMYFLYTSKQTRTADVTFYQNPPNSIEVESTNINAATEPTEPTEPTEEPTEESSRTVNVASSQTTPNPTEEVEDEFTVAMRHWEMCLELGTTMRGFSGPNDRMNIFKNYGYSPSLASFWEDLLQKVWRQMDLYNDPHTWPSRYACYQKSVDCLQFMEGANGTISKTYSDAIDKIDECLSVKPDKPIF